MHRPLAVLALLGLLTACTHPLEIVGQGDLLSATGENDCLLEQQPCEAVAVTEYIETYTAVPRPGFVFAGWEGCESDTNECSFNVPEAVVIDNWFTTAPPLIATFVADSNCSEAPADTFATIQQVIFNGRGCSSGGCHSGNRPTGNMNLSNGNSFAATVGVRAASSPLNRIQAGDANNSYLFRKVSASTNPGSFTISGNPMPFGRNPLSQAQLDALALWIDAGAPQTGRASPGNEVEQLLGACG